MYFYILISSAILTVCSTESPPEYQETPKYSSSEAVSSQSFTRHDVPLSYKLSHPHPYYETTKLHPVTEPTRIYVTQQPQEQYETSEESEYSSTEIPIYFGSTSPAPTEPASKSPEPIKYYSNYLNQQFYTAIQGAQRPSQYYQAQPQEKPQEQPVHYSSTPSLKYVENEVPSVKPVSPPSVTQTSHQHSVVHIPKTQPQVLLHHMQPNKQQHHTYQHQVPQYHNYKLVPVVLKYQLPHHQPSKPLEVTPTRAIYLPDHQSNSDVTTQNDSKESSPVSGVYQFLGPDGTMRKIEFHDFLSTRTTAEPAHRYVISQPAYHKPQPIQYQQQIYHHQPKYQEQTVYHPQIEQDMQTHHHYYKTHSSQEEPKIYHYQTSTQDQSNLYHHQSLQEQPKVNHYKSQTTQEEPKLIHHQSQYMQEQQKVYHHQPQSMQDQPRVYQYQAQTEQPTIYLKQSAYHQQSQPTQVVSSLAKITLQEKQPMTMYVPSISQQNVSKNNYQSYPIVVHGNQSV